MTRQRFSLQSSAGPSNWLLAALPQGDYERIRPDLKPCNIASNQVLHHAGEPIRHVYFPETGVFSVATVLPDGAMVEAALVGSEGILGIPAFFASDALAHGHSIVEVTQGRVVRLDAPLFRREMDRRGALYSLVARYIPIRVAQTMQLTACNAVHRIEQRLARWLLTTDDRVPQQREFRVSHEFIAMMLGARRPTVTVAAGALQRAGLIAYKHGRVSINDRRRLEHVSCDCYPAMRAQLSLLRQEFRYVSRPRDLVARCS